jgi:hypothetical protein
MRQSWLNSLLRQSTSRETKLRKRRQRRRSGSSLRLFEQLESRIVFSAPQGDNRFFGAITSPGQHETYNFTLSAAAPVWVDSETYDSNLNWQITGPTGIVPTPATGNGATPFSYDDQYLGLLQAGTYSVSVTAADDATGSFAFRVLDMTSAAATTLTPGTPVSGTMDPSNFTNLYKFSGTAGSTLYFDNTAWSTTDPNNYTGYSNWTLYDQYGNQVFDSVLASDAGRYTLANTATYTLAVHGNVFTTGTTSYTFNVAPVTDDAAALTLGSSTTGNISSVGQHDTYTFTLGAAARLWFDSQTNNGNLSWQLTGPTGNVSGPNYFSWDDQNVGLLQAGTYTLTVSGYVDSTGAYTFKLLNLASATAFTAGTSGSPTGATVSSVLNPGNEIDLYKFTGTAGDSLLFDNISLSINTAAYWQLVDPYGGIVFNDYLGYDQTPAPLAYSGTYTLVLYGSVSEAATTNYSFRVNYLSHTNPTTITGAALTFGTTYNDTTNPIDGTGEADFKFTLAAPKRLWFDSQYYDGTYNLSWQLTGPTTSVSGYFDDGDYDADLLQAGTYSFKVFGAAGSAYAFRLLDFAAATTITPGTAVSATLNPSNSEKLYKFSGNAGTVLYFDNTAWSTTDPNYTSIGYSNWTLYDQYGAQIFSQNMSDAGRITLPNTGTYTLAVGTLPYLTGTTSYTFNVRPITDDTTALTLGTATSGSIASPGQQDTYTFTLNSSAFLWFDSQTNNGSFNWQLKGPTGIVPTYATGQGYNQFDYDDQYFGLLPAGAYTLTVGGWGDLTGNYSFNLLNLASASAVSLGSDVSGTLNPSNSTNLYKFSGTAGSTLYFDNTAFSTTDPNNYIDYSRWVLYDQNGNQVFNQGLSDAGRITLPATGTYTLAIWSYVWVTGSTSYTFNIRPTADDVAALTLGTAVSGGISTPGQNDRYTVTLASPTRIQFDSRTNDGSLYWQLTGPTGTVVAATYFSYDDQYLNLLPAGAYTLTVSGNGEYTGSYAFNLLDFAAATAITPGTPVNGTLNPSNSTKAYKFSGTAGNVLYFDNTAFSTTDPNNEISYSGWALYDAYGTQVFSQGLQDAGRITLPTTGTYTLVVGSQVWITGQTSYAFNVAPVTDDAAALTLGALTSGSIDTVGQHDVYTFTLAAAARLWFDSQTNNGNLNWQLIGPTGTVFSPWPFSYDDQSVGLLQAGTYTLTVAGNVDSTGSYTFKLLNLASATAFTAGTSGSPTGATVNGVLNPSNEADLYRFTGTAGDSLQFDNLSISINTSAYWQLIDPYGAVVFTDYLGYDQTPAPLANSGTYTLVLYGAVGEAATTNYSFRVNYLSHTNPTTIIGTTITFGTLYNNSTNPISPVSNEADFQFTLAVPKRLWFDSQYYDGTFAASWQITGPQGVVPTPDAGYDVTYFDYDDQNLGLLPAGTYSLKVFGDSSASYAFKLLDFAGATTITPGTAVSGTLNPSNAEKLYKFSGTAGNTLFFDNTAFSTTDPNNWIGYSNWTLLDQYGTQIFSQPLYDAGRFTLPNTGTYTLAVGTPVSITGTTSYTFNVLPTADDAATLTLGTAVSGNISVPGQYDTYTFTLGAPARLRFDSQTNDGNVGWYLSGPAGIAPTPSAGYGINWFNYDDQDLGLLPAGAYTLTAVGSGDYTGAYAFNLLDFAAASAITLGTDVSNTLNPSNSLQLYTFSGTAGSKLYFDNLAFSTTDPNSSIGNSFWTLYDQYGTQVFSHHYLTDAGRITLPTTGNYTLAVWSDVWVAGTTSYTFNVRPVIDDVATLWGTGADDAVSVQYLTSSSEDVFLNGYLMGTMTGSKPLTIDGKGGTDSLSVTGTSSADTFTITPTTAALASANLNLVGITTRTIDGGAGADTFNYSGANPDLTLLGGSSTDIFKPADGATIKKLDGGTNGATINYSLSSVGVVLDVAAGNVTGVTQIANITGVVGSPQSDAPIGIPKTVTTPEDTIYTFVAADFGFTDPGDSPANSLLAVEIVTLPGVGSLTNNGVAVTAGDFIPVANITGGLLKFTPVADANGAPYASFTFQVQDNGSTANSGLVLDPTARTMTVNVTAVNDAPVIANYAASDTYVENGAPLAILSNGTSVTDIDSADFNTGKLTVTKTVANSYYDVLGIANQGTGAGQIGVSGSTVTYQGATIGTFVGGTKGVMLVVTFNSAAATPAAVQALMRAITFSIPGDAPFTPTRTVRFTLTDGDGGTANLVDQTIAVTAVNDAPTIAGPTAQSVTSNTPLVFSNSNGNMFSLADLDAASSQVQLTVSASNGFVTLIATNGLTFTAGANGQASFTIKGTLSALNNALDGLSFATPLNFVGNASLQLTLNDLGNAGTGGAQSTVKTVAITVDNAGSVVDNGTAGYAETVGAWSTSGVTGYNGTTSRFSTSAGATATWTSTLSAGYYKVELYKIVATGNTTNATFSVVHNGVTDSQTVDLSAGSSGFANLGTYYFSGAAGELAKLVRGSSGTVRADAVRFTPVFSDVAPSVSAPSVLQDTDKNTALTFSLTAGNAISLADADATAAAVEELDLAATNGTITLSTLAGLTIVSGANGSASVGVTGTLSALNSAVSGLNFTPASNYTGGASLQFTLNDLGNSGGGGPLSATRTVSIGVVATPTVVDNGTTGYAETVGTWATSGLTGYNGSNTRYSSSSGATATWTTSFAPGFYKVELYKIVSTGNTTNATFSVLHNGITDSQTVDLTTGSSGFADMGTYYFSGAGGELAKLVRGSSGNVRADAVRFTPIGVVDNGTAGYAETAGTWTTSGLTGYNGSSTRYSASANATATWTTGFVPGYYKVELYKVVSAGNTTNATFSVVHNGITDSQTVDLTTGSSGFADLGTYYFSGAGGELAKLVRGSSGNVRTDAVRFTRIHANSAPLVSVPGPQFTNENAAVTFSAAKGTAIVLSDANAGSTAEELTLTASNGVVTLSTLTGLTITSGANGSAAVTVQGSLAALNVALSGLLFTPTSNYFGAASLQVSLNDLGVDGAGGAMTTAQTIAITVNAPRFIIDNGDAGYAETSAWYDSGFPGSFGSTARYTAAVAGSVQWTPTLTAGSYAVAFYKVANAANQQNATLSINHNGTLDTQSINLASGTSAWVELGTFQFSGAGGEFIKLSQSTAGTIRADAVRFTKVGP